MPAAFSYPGVYIEEIPTGGARPITAVPTSITAFVGTAGRGPTDAPQHITSLAEFQRIFGTIGKTWPMTLAVEHFYLNGGSEAEVVRITPNDAAPATLQLTNGPTLKAASAGRWGDSIRARAEDDPDDAAAYVLAIRDTATGAEERYEGLSTDDESPLYVGTVLAGSGLMRLDTGGDQKPDANADIVPGTDPFADNPRLVDPNDTRAPWVQAANGSNGTTGNLTQSYIGNEADKTGIHQLLKVDIFNLMCVLPPRLQDDVPDTVLMPSAALCLRERAMLIVDPLQAWDTVGEAVSEFDNHILAGTDAARNAALYFPRIRIPDPDDPEASVTVPASGALAGIYARTDGARGVWKAPAGQEAGIGAARELQLKLSDLENGRLNRIGVNALRQFPGLGRLVWGARTMRGADRILDDPSWRYVPIRRTALMIEESLYRGTQFAVFEPNDEPLWSAVRLSVGAFMNSLFRQGAFQGSTPRDAYLVKCDKENNPQADIDRGILNILVGFAPLKPAEFVYIRLQQLAGQTQV